MLVKQIHANALSIRRKVDSMAVLVTGCAGFIGWKVCETLLREGTRVVGVDDLNDHYDPRLKQWRLDRLKQDGNFTFARADVSRRDELWEVLRTLRPQGEEDLEAIINLAARPGVRQSIVDPFKYFQTNVIGALNLIEWACREGIPRYVLASSSSVYGESCPRPFREDARTDEPVSPYAASKKAAEVLCHAYHYLYGIDVTVLRYFTVYGPAGRPDMAMFRFIRWVAEGETIRIYGDGEQERDFTYVDDIASGTVKALELSGFNVINLGSDRPVTVNEVLRVISAQLGKEPAVSFLPPEKTDVRATWANISRARSLIAWEPETALEDGVRAAIDWYLENRSWLKEINI